MKRLVALAALLSAVSLVPASAELGDVASCTATTGVTALAVVPESAPTCTFEIACFSSIFTQCTYGITLDVNGTGAVSGTMSAVPVFGTARFADSFSGTPDPSPSCSGTFQCHFATDASNLTVLVTSPGSVTKIVCSGGGLALVETVGCSLTTFSE